MHFGPVVLNRIDVFQNATIVNNESAVQPREL